jgi:hypothetical protein
LTPVEALAAAAQAGVILAVNTEDQLTADPPGRLAPDVRAALVAHKDQLKAVLRLREIHRAMGFDESDVRMIEEALLSGKVNEVTIVPAPAGGWVA